MEYKNLQLKCLEDRHKLSILLILYREGKKKKTDLYQLLPSNSRMADKLNELENSGLIVQENLKFQNNTTYLDLTEKGRKIAGELYKIEMLLSGEYSADIEEKIIEEEVQRRVKEQLEEDDEISSSAAVLSVREKEED